MVNGILVVRRLMGSSGVVLGFAGVAWSVRVLPGLNPSTGRKADRQSGFRLAQSLWLAELVDFVL